MADETMDTRLLLEEIKRLRARGAERESLEARHAEAEKALAESEELYRAVVENVADGIAITVGRDRVFVNKAFLAIHGITDLSQVIGLPFDQFIVPEDRDGVAARVLARQQGKPIDDNMNEYRIRRADGATRNVQASVVTINYQGQPAVLAVLRDTTKLKEAENKILSLNKELEQHVEELRTTNQELQAVNSMVSHDLRVPLIAIEGFVRRLAEHYGTVLDERGLTYLDITQKNVKRMGRLIEDLLAYGRLGKQEIVRSPVDMDQLARSVAEELRMVFSEGTTDLAIDHLLPAFGDEHMLRQVLTNLLANAFKFSRNREKRVISVECHKDGGQNIYAVCDNGAGFPADQKERLFHVFQRLHSSDEFEGTGMGLAIVKRIVERHGGRVWAEGEADKGATFFFSLPSGPEGPSTPP